MKIKYLWLMASGVVAAGVAAGLTEPPRGLVAHEWGTFTSYQGGDGELMRWKPLETAQLPKFVYDWQHPGMDRVPTAAFFFGKGTVTSLQRMETPVIYFYSDREQSVDITVRFPQGTITEWYPQACGVGPSMVPPGKGVVTTDAYLHKAGVSRNFTVASLLGRDIKESLIHWTDLKILPAQRHKEIAALLPKDNSGSNYFAARETDAAYIRADSFAKTNSGPEHEKFLFYRGVANFATPLRVTMTSDNAVTVANTGAEKLAHLFVLGVKNKAGSFVYVDGLQPGEERTVLLNLQTSSLPQAVLDEQIGQKLTKALVAEGLYPREAAAMVNTWKDSWFEEEGLRVLYVLPRAWTDRTLPMEMSPAPKELTRVMVGRAEVLAPGMERALTLELDQAAHGDAEAKQNAAETLKKLGRFAEPAFYRAIVKTKALPEEQNKLVPLLYAGRAAN